MAWLQALDVNLFHFVNLTLRHPALDGVMRFLSGNALFGPVLTLLGIWLVCKGGRRGRALALMMAIILPMGDGLIVNPLKHAISRERPAVALTDAHLVMGNPDSRSMPSAHAANWFAATMIAFYYYRRTWRAMLPLALAVALSRVYVGAHYPSDVLVGAILGTGYAVAGLLGVNALWQRLGQDWFPLWWARMPSLLQPELGSVQSLESKVLRHRRSTQDSGPQAQDSGPQAQDSGPETQDSRLTHHWLRLGYVGIAAALLARLAFIASGTIELSKDEAYQWLWSKHLALSYYSKPPLIAYTQWLGTHLWGDTAFGVRFFAPVIGAVLALVLFRWMARLANARAAFCLLLVLLATPLLGVGTTLLTIDPLLVMFWTAAMVLGWRAVQAAGTTWHWLGVGLAIGLAFLSKYTGLYQIICFGLFFALWPAARVHLRRAGPWLALAVVGLCMVPVLVWNAQHDWITLTHVSQNASLREPWHPTLRYLFEFTAAELGLLSPVFLVAALWAMVGLWKSKVQSPESKVESDPLGATFNTQHATRNTQHARLKTQDSRLVLMIYLFCMSAPVFLGHLLYTLHSQVQPNWIAPAVVPMFCLMVLYWEQRRLEGARGIMRWLRAGVILGLAVVLFVHEPGVVAKVLGQPLPADKDPLRRVRAWQATAGVVEEARARLLAEGKPVFVLVHHYGITGLLSFYLPEARPGGGRVTSDEGRGANDASPVTRPPSPAMPLVYAALAPFAENQFYFWPEYRYHATRKGQNAIYVMEAELPPYPLKAWVKSVLSGQPGPLPPRPPAQHYYGFIPYEFESFKDLGIFPVIDRGQVYRWVQLVECRNLR